MGRAVQRASRGQRNFSPEVPHSRPLVALALLRQTASQKGHSLRVPTFASTTILRVYGGRKPSAASIGKGSLEQIAAVFAVRPPTPPGPQKSFLANDLLT